MNNGSMTKPPVPLTKRKGLHALLRELSDDEDDPMEHNDLPDDPRRPWLRDYR
jgi:hypothetical protein